jgi:hypothetical protein
MMLQHTVLRDGSTWAARAWTCVAGHNIVPRAQPTNFSSAFQYSTQARTQRTTTHLSWKHGWRAHTSWTQSKFSCVVRNTPGLPTHAHRALAGTAPHCQKLCRTDETSGLQAGARHDSHLRKHVPAHNGFWKSRSHCAQDRAASLCRNSDSPSRLRLKPA